MNFLHRLEGIRLATCIFIIDRKKSIVTPDGNFNENLLLPIVVEIVSCFHSVRCIAMVLKLDEGEGRPWKLDFNLSAWSEAFYCCSLTPAIFQIDEYHLPEAIEQVFHVFSANIRRQVTDINTTIVSRTHISRWIWSTNYGIQNVFSRDYLDLGIPESVIANYLWTDSKVNLIWLAMIYITSICGTIIHVNNNQTKLQILSIAALNFSFIAW